MFNPVAPGCLLPNVYLFMTDIVNPDLSSVSAWPACQKTANRSPIAGDGEFLHNLHISMPSPL